MPAPSGAVNTMSHANQNSWNFHPLVQSWFDDRFGTATTCQRLAWPAVQDRRHVLVSAPTGSGKTLAAFLAVIDEIIQLGLRENGLPDATQVVYVSPLKALSYDIERNLEAPLLGIRQRLAAAGLTDIEIRTGVRTGDTTQYERQKMVRKPPHILVTTPESFYLLLTSASGRQMLRTVSRLIVDEIHALAGNKRGAHFSLSMARFERLIGRAPVKIGLSATQKPLPEIASFLTGRRMHDCVIVDTGHVRKWDLDVCVPTTPLAPVMSMQSWGDIYQQIAAMIQRHRTTLIFVNTRRHVERATRHLCELLGEESIGSHHGSLSKEHRHQAEQDLKSGELQALVATASLELGIDIGDVDLVCQIGSPRSIAVFLQRVGRSGHAVERIPKGRIFPTTRDELVESVALLRSISDGQLESLEICDGAMDVVAQQTVAEVSVEDCDIDELHQLWQTAYPYRNLSKNDYGEVLRMLSEGFTFRRGRRGAHIHLDAVNRKLRARRGGRLVAATNAGVIPDLFDYDVILMPEETRIGTVNEDFAFESLTGDIFQLGNTSYRVQKVEKGCVRVEDAKGLPPNIPFWIGEGRGRSDLLSAAVSRLREDAERLLQHGSCETAAQLFAGEYAVSQSIATQVMSYLDAARKALGLLPTRNTIVFERFFDAAGDAHLVIHSVYGSRLNKAWGLALRKRFCVRFNFELQAAALEDCFILSLGPTHSFALEEVRNYVKSASSTEVLMQAVLGAPMFGTRWRWVANTALAVLRFSRGRKVPPPLQRNDSEDLLSLVFPDQVACQENITGPIEIPDHPLIQQTLRDCLQELMDARGFSALLRQIENDEVSIVYRDLSEPSPLTHEVLTAKPYAFLDDAPAEERRTLAVQTRRLMGVADIAEFGRFDAAVLQTVADQLWPRPRNAEELHDALVNVGYFYFADSTPVDSRSTQALTADVCQPTWQDFVEQLQLQNRVTRVALSQNVVLWVAAERLDELLLLHPDAKCIPNIKPVSFAKTVVDSRQQALVSLLRSRLAAIGPRTTDDIAASIDLPMSEIEGALSALENEGSLMRGHYRENVSEEEWCERNYLARLHNTAISTLRKRIKPVDAKQYVNYLRQWMRLSEKTVGEGIDALSMVLDSLEGFEAPAGVWEAEILAARIYRYDPGLLDGLNTTGRFLWCRLSAPEGLVGRHPLGRIYRQRNSIRSIPLTFLSRSRLRTWKQMAGRRKSIEPELSGNTRRLLAALTDLGPLFFEEIQDELAILPAHLEQCIVELFSLGVVTCDHYAGIRALLMSERDRRKKSRLGRLGQHSVRSSGRWSLLLHPRRTASARSTEDELIEAAGQALLRRYGIVYPDLLSLEARFMPRWRALRRYFARLEDRGELRGGRFVEGVGGEQFALPQAIELLRSSGASKEDGKSLMIHSADPFNLSSVIASAAPVNRQSNAYLIYRDGELVDAVDNVRQFPKSMPLR